MLELKHTNCRPRLQTMPLLQKASLISRLMVAAGLRLACRKAGNSLLRAQLAVKNRLQFREGPPELAPIQKVRRIPRSTGKIQLRFRVCLKQQHSSRTQSPANLRKQRSLQISHAQNQEIAIHPKLRAFQIRLYQVNSCARLLCFFYPLNSAHRETQRLCALFEEIQRRLGPVHRRNRSTVLSQKNRVSSAATGQVERRPRGQQWPQLGQNPRGSLCSFPPHQAMFGVPIGLAWAHKKSS